MSPSYSKWSDVKTKGRALDPRDTEDQAAGKAAARERTDAYVRGHQLAEMRTAAGVTQAELADALGVSQARVSKIEHGEISGIDVVRAYVSALGGTIDVVARLGDRSWKVALSRCAVVRSISATTSGPMAMITETMTLRLMAIVGISAIHTASVVITGRMPAVTPRAERAIYEEKLGTGHPSWVSGLPDIRGTRISRFGRHPRRRHSPEVDDMRVPHTEP